MHKSLSFSDVYDTKVYEVCCVVFVKATSYWLTVVTCPGSMTSIEHRIYGTLQSRHVHKTKQRFRLVAASLL